MNAAILFPLLLAGVQVPAFDLSALTLAVCRRLHGQEVVVHFAIGAAPMAHDGITNLGPGELPDGSERSAVVVGERRGFAVGERVAVRGVLLVRNWPAAVVNGVAVPAWDQAVVVRAGVMR